jgi:hypothetical protein
MFYDADILEEKVLLEWAGKVSKKYVSRELSQEIHAKAEPFIKWLKEAEEEDDSDSEEEGEDDDDLEVCFMHFKIGYGYSLPIVPNSLINKILNILFGTK